MTSPSTKPAVKVLLSQIALIVMHSMTVKVWVWEQLHPSRKRFLL